jgi:hypothetical protein
MKQLLAYRSPNAWSRVLAFLISVTFMIVWLPFIRSLFDGVTYVWGMSYFGFAIHGAGVTPAFSFLVLQLAFYAALIVGMYRMKNRLLYHILLAVWWINVFGNLLFDIAVNGDTMFHGDTLNVHISITMIVVPLSLLALLIVALFIRSESSALLPEPGPWTPRNSQLTNIFLISLPVLFILLFFGEPHALTDEIGVLIAIAHCFYLPIVFRPFGATELSRPSYG